MLFLLTYGLYCIKFDKSSKKYIPFAVICLIYSIFGLITEITVNLATIPAVVNDICHILYFTFGLLFSFNYFKYVLELVVTPKTLKIEEVFVIDDNSEIALDEIPVPDLTVEDEIDMYFEISLKMDIM